LISRLRFSTLRAMRLGTLVHDLLYAPDDERWGGWSREELEHMNGRFAATLEEAFASGLESRASAAAQVKLPANGGPRFVVPLCPVVRDALWRSSPPSEAVFVWR
jgi:hypothetical protein